MEFTDSGMDDVEMTDPDALELASEASQSDGGESYCDGDDESNGVMSSEEEYLGELDPQHATVELR